MEWTQLIHCAKLTNDEKVVLGIILDYNNLKIEGKWNNTPQKQLIVETNKAKNTIKKVVTSLESKGLIVNEPDVYGSADNYMPIVSNIKALVKGSKNEPKHTGKGQKSTEGRGKKSTNEGSKSNPNTNINNTNTNNANIENCKMDLIDGQSKPTSEVNQTRSVNEEYIDRLEQQFNHIPKTDKTTSPTDQHITSEQIEALDVTMIRKDTIGAILNTIVEASRSEYTFIAAMNKSNEFLQVWRRPMRSICITYHNAHRVLKRGGFSEKKTKYAADTLQTLKSNIIECGGKEMLDECKDIEW